MHITESTKEQIRRGLLAALLGGLGFVSLAIVKEAAKPFADHVVPVISSTNLLWLSLLLLMTNLVSGTWLLFLIFSDRTERLRRRYTFLKERGFWMHRKTGQYICGNCLIAGLESPLAQYGYHDDEGKLMRAVWACGRKECKTEYDFIKSDIRKNET